MNQTLFLKGNQSLLMKSTFLLFLLFSALFSNAQTVTRMYTDYNGFFTSNDLTNVVQPDNRHNLLAFEIGSTVYSTGVNDGNLTANGVTGFTSGNYRGFSFNTIPGNVGGANYLALGSRLDGNGNSGVANTLVNAATIGISPREVLTDGLKGLDIGTGLTNLPNTALIEMRATIDPANSALFNDAMPDILITQIADASANSDKFRFTDSAGNTVGTQVTASFATGSNGLAVYKVDFFNLTNGTLANAVTASAGSAGASTRNIKINAYKLSDFGITAANAGSIAFFKILPSGDGDAAFYAYNEDVISNGAPIITTQPISQTVCPGLSNSVTFSVVATGSSLTYQWRKNGVNISGATSSSYTDLDVVTGDAGAYSVVVGNSEGTVTSTIGYLNLNLLLSPSNASTVCGTGDVVLNSGAQGNNLSYQWYSNTTNSNTGGTLISGATSYLYNAPNTPAGTYYYYATITSDGQACASVKTGVSVVTITSGAVATTATSLSPTVCLGSAGSVRVAGGSLGTIKWQSSTNPTSGFANVAGGTGATYAVPASTINAVGTYYFRATFTTTVPCAATDTSNVVSIVVSALSNAGTVSSNQTLCNNTATTVSTTGSNGVLQWEQASVISGPWTNVIGGSGATTASYSTPNLTNTTFYRVISTNAPCGNATSGVSTVTVNAVSNAGTISANKTICSNITTTVSTTGSNGTLQWQQSNNVSGPWSNVIGGSGATTSIYTTATLTSSTYYRVISTNSPCAAANSDTVLVSISDIADWTGATSSDWNTPGNWSCNIVPTLSLNANIPVVTTYPILSTTTGNSKNLTIASGASVTVNGTGVLNIAGSVSNSGTFDAIDGTVGFVGTVMQTIPANTFSTDYIKNLNIKNTAGVAMNSATSLTGILTVNDGGSFNTNDFLTLKSTATQTAVIAPVVGTFTGTMTIERYIPAKRAFRFLSSPTDGGTIRSNWMENGVDVAGLGTDITGAGGASNGFDISGSNNPSLFTYLNNNPGSGPNWNAVTSATISQVAGVPYRMLVRGDRLVDQTNNNATATATTLRTKGTIKYGDVSVADLNPMADGFNLIGNPYQSPVNMYTLLNDVSTTGIKKTFYTIWDPNVNTRGGYVTVTFAPLEVNDIVSVQDNTSPTNTGASRYLQPGQAAFVQTQVAGAPSLIFKENQKALSFSNVFRQANDGQSKIRFTLYTANALANGNSAADGFVVTFDESDENAANEFDAIKAVNQDESLGMMNSDKIYSFQRMAMPTLSDVIPLSSVQYRTTDYTFRVAVEGLSDVTPMLLDKYTQSTFALVNNEVTDINFTVNPAIEASTDANRFDIIFQETALGNNDNAFGNAIRLYPNPSATGNFFIALPSQFAGQASVEIVSLLGQKVFTQTTNATSNVLDIQPTNQLQAGVYFVNVTTAQGKATKKLIIK